jgi:DNA-binding HxlR family transcriptional regulator
MRGAVARAEQNCPTELALEVVGGKWKLMILDHLAEDTHRFSELQRAIPGITPRTLSRQLRELETDRVVRRIVYPEVPPRVEYSLTALGRSLAPLLDELRRWGAQYGRRYAMVGKLDPDEPAGR